MKKLINKKDLMLIGGLLIASLGFFVLQNAGQNFAAGEIDHRVYAEITLHGELIYTTYLDEEREFILPEHPGVRFAVREEMIAFVHADCPDLMCIIMGWQGNPGQWAACLPNGLLLMLYGASDNTGIDVLVR